jgi:hypothetical protein
MNRTPTNTVIEKNLRNFTTLFDPPFFMEQWGFFVIDFESGCNSLIISLRDV